MQRHTLVSADRARVQRVGRPFGCLFSAMVTGGHVMIGGNTVTGGYILIGGDAVSGVKNRAIRMPCVHIRAVHGTVLVLCDCPYRGGDL